MDNTQQKILAVFDFDNTLVDGNTDTWVLDLHPPCRQQMNQQKSEGHCWTDIMHSIFSVLHKKDVRKQDYESCFKSLQFTEGIKETCDFLKNMNIQSVIVSDSNSYFIEHLLQRDSLQEVFSSIYTNPAQWNKDGRLTVERYHSHTCGRCPENLCKGEVLKKYLEKQRLKTGQKFDYIVYIGDGQGDVCAALTLEASDMVLAREGYILLNDLQKQLEMSQGMLPQAKVVSWKTGFDVLKEFQTLIQRSTMKNDLN